MPEYTEKYKDEYDNGRDKPLTASDEDISQLWLKGEAKPKPISIPLSPPEPSFFEKFGGLLLAGGITAGLGLMCAFSKDDNLLCPTCGSKVSKGQINGHSKLEKRKTSKEKEGKP